MMNPSHGRGLGSAGGSSSGRNQGGGGETVVEMFPSGLRVLVVDDDPTCLMILERMLRTCLYEGSYPKTKIFSFHFFFFFFCSFNLTREREREREREFMVSCSNDGFICGPFSKIMLF
jgi:hypothetical protein